MNMIKIIILLVYLTNVFTSFGQSYTSITSINSMTISSNTGEKPQSKVWSYDNKWWSVLSDGTGTYIWELKYINNEYVWVRSLQLSNSTKTYADCKLNSNSLHILLFDKNASLPKASLISVHYDQNRNSYSFLNNNTNPLDLILNNSVETATIDIDSQNRLWIAYEKDTKIYVRWTNFPYTTWSNELTIYNGVKNDDICSIIHLNDKIGVLWSNQNTKRFGFKVHEDSNPPSTWSLDEVPSSGSAHNIGNGMADDHLNMAVLNDGTLYCAIKTSYDANGSPKIGLIVRDPNGSWSQLYNVSESGTRPIVTLNETTNKLQVVYTSSESGGNILYKESDISQIMFGNSQILISADPQNSLNYNNVSSSKNNYTSEIVILASSGNQLASVIANSD
jgi:hypothetical protein